MKTFRNCCYRRFASLFLALGAVFFVILAQAQQPAALVIEGGNLIDGNGGTPLQDSVVVVQGSKITAVGRRGQITYPPGAQVVKADGKFVVPGLWDNHTADR